MAGCTTRCCCCCWGAGNSTNESAVCCSTGLKKVRTGGGCNTVESYVVQALHGGIELSGTVNICEKHSATPCSYRSTRNDPETNGMEALTHKDASTKRFAGIRKKRGCQPCVHSLDGETFATAAPRGYLGPPDPTAPPFGPKRPRPRASPPAAPYFGRTNKNAVWVNSAHVAGHSQPVGRSLQRRVVCAGGGAQWRARQNTCRRDQSSRCWGFSTAW
ncbi:ATP-dependent DNA helicase RecQ [Trypanosoma cruzi]|nr:ATP-dependent DNA helicase RecQ [Trypanosoma cruzi]